ncbi:MAG: glycoside hydrolase family 52 protein [Phycisphaerae bacterium]
MSEMRIPAFTGAIGFNAHHAPMGAFFSFTCGHPNTKGGIGWQAGKPGNQDIYIGIKEGDRYSKEPLKCLPFYEGALAGAGAAQNEIEAQAQAAAANFLVEQSDPALADPDADKKKPKVTAYPLEKLKRYYGWGTDTWESPDFRFQICTPFGEIPDPANATAEQMRAALVPGVVCELRVDNRKGTTPKTGFFALGFGDAGNRMLDSGLGQGRGSQRLGFALRGHQGVAAELFDTTNGDYVPATNAPFGFMRWSPNDGIADRDNPIHLLGSCPGIGFEVPPGKCYSLDIAVGVFSANVETTRLETRYLYARYFASLEDVLGYTLDHGYDAWKLADQRDNELLASGLNADQQFMLAHATRSYYGATQMLDLAGQPYWVVNEGEYCMINTLDLSVDQVFWELRYNPWMVKNLLDNFVRYYSYTDQTRDPKTGAMHPGGISFAHDQGIHNQFSPIGRSSYELTALDGCFSHMTMEQLCNWSLIAASYVVKTGDVTWARQSAPVLAACVESLRNRCPQGVMTRDSSRCGHGQEITTYDSLDASLGQARNNLYLAVKGWATALGLSYLAKTIGATKLAQDADLLADQAARQVAAQAAADGSLPAVFEPENPGYRSRILPAIEGLVYPWYWQQCDPQGWGQQIAATWLNEQAGNTHAQMLQALRKHTLTLLNDPQNLNRFPDGGLKLSSSSYNSWMSKIAIFQQVARSVLKLDQDAAYRKADAAADAAHVRWQTLGASAYWACSDQMVKGIAIGSKYYPRIVTSVLWLDNTTK